MANADAPRGFTPVRRLNGRTDGGLTYAYIPSSNATATFIGDVVIHNSDGGAAALTINGMDFEGVPQVVRATTGSTGQDIFGVVVGFLPDPTSLGTVHRAASTNRVALVALATDWVFECQEDTITSALGAANLGSNIAFTTTAGSTTTGRSGMELDSNTAANTSTLPLRLVSLVKRPNNALNTAGADADQAKWEVIFNTSIWAPNITALS